jgi:hypothetical protein
MRFLLETNITSEPMKARPTAAIEFNGLSPVVIAYRNPFRCNGWIRDPLTL